MPAPIFKSLVIYARCGAFFNYMLPYREAAHNNWMASLIIRAALVAGRLLDQYNQHSDRPSKGYGCISLSERGRESRES